MAPSLLRDFKIEEIVGWTALRFAEETEAWESVERLLAGGAAERDLVGTRRKLRSAADAGRVASEMCRRGCQRLLRCALSERPALATARLPQQRTLLHVAAEAGSVVALRSLLDAGASANACDRAGVTPLHEAAAHCCYYALLLLLKAGADASAVDQGGRTALHYAARGGSVPAIQVLMSEGLRTDAASASGWTPLHEAASRCNPQCVFLLLESGADALATTAAGWTALHAAAATGTIRAVRILLDAGVPVDARTLEEETALHLAAERGADDVVTTLAEAGADLEAVDRAGRTPSRRAAERRLKEEVAVARALSMSAAAPEDPSPGGDPAGNARRSTRSPAPENTEEATQEVEVPPPDSDIPCGDDVSEYSYLSDQSYSDSCSESDGECSSVDTASEKYTSYETLPSTASTAVMGNPHPNYQKHPHSHRGMYRGRGGARFVKHGSTDAIFKQSQGKGHHQAHTKQHSGHRQEVHTSGENKLVRTRPRNRHHQHKHEQQTHQHQNQVPHAQFQHQQQQQPHKQHPHHYQHNKKQHKQQQNQQGAHNKPANNTNPHSVGKHGVNMNLKIPQLQGFSTMSNPFTSNQQLFPSANVNNRSPQGNSGHTAQNRSQQSTAASNLVDELERLKQRVTSIALTPPQKVNHNQK